MKTNLLQIRLSEDEKMSYETAAANAEMTVSAWVRDRLRAAALREMHSGVSYSLDTSETYPAYAAEGKPIWEEILEIGESIPKSEWDKLPRDLARNMDRYLGSSDW